MTIKNYANRGSQQDYPVPSSNNEKVNRLSKT